MATIHGKSLTECSIYQLLNQNDYITKTIENILRRGEVCSPTQLDDFISTVMKRFRYTEKYKVMEKLKSGEIKIILAPLDKRVPAAIPFSLTIEPHEGGRRLSAYVFADNFLKRKNDQGYEFDNNKLYATIVSAYVAIHYMKNPSVVKLSNVETMGTKIYSAMFARVLNKQYSLNVDKIRLQKVQFLAGLFFVVNVLRQKFDDHAANLAIGGLRDPNRIMLNQILENIDEAIFKDLGTFIRYLSSEESGLSLDGLNTRAYVEAFILMYESTALLALESFPHFMFNMISVAQSAFLNKQFAFEEIGDDMPIKIYNAVVAE